METKTTTRSPAPPESSRGFSAQVESADPEGVTVLQTVTLVLWVVCVAIGVLGIVLQPVPPPPPAPKPPDLPPVQAEIIKVDFDQPVAQVPPEQQTPPDQSVPQDIPPLPEVAMLTPAIKFALPVEGPVSVVGSGRARYTRPPASAGPVRRLTFGAGVPKQPDPEYPSESIQGSQQGDVGVTFTVGPDGRVVSAHVSSPSRWPLLNNAALEVVRDQWHFPPSWAGSYDYTFQFRLK